MDRGLRFLTVVVSGILCVLGFVAVMADGAENDEISLLPRPAQLPPDFLNVGPGPLPPRRGPTSKIDQTSALTTEQAIVQCVETDMEAIGAPGAAVTVMVDGQVIFNRGFGYKHQGRPELVDADTRFRIGSATKMMTAAAVMQQVEVGLVNLDAPVTDWIPELSLSGRWPADSITVRNLLTHSAAIPDYYEDPLGPTGDQALGEWAGTLSDVRLHAPPGTFWNYTNPGFALAGLVAERASGLPYRELLDTRIFDAAGMSKTTFDPAEVVASGNFAYGHEPNSTGQPTVWAPDSFDSWVASPSGLAFSTASDLALWGQLLMDGGGAVLSDSSTETMQRRQIFLDYVPDFHYGFGIFAEIYNRLDVRQHGGNLVGWGAFLLWVPEERFVVSILDNTLIHLTAAGYCIVDAVLELEVSPPPDYSTDPETWGRFNGRYRFMDNHGDLFDAEVTKDEERFSITFIDPDEPGPYQTDLVHQYLDTFIIDLDGDQVPDPLFDLTFIHRTASGSKTMWLRNRSFVGRRVLPPRRPYGRRAPE